jgi:hypothetical protein
MCAGALRRVLMAWIGPGRRPGRRAAAVTAPPTAMLLNGAADMTGSTLAVILIPPAGTIFLAAWLAVVFYAGRDHLGPDATRRPAAKALARPRWLSGVGQTPAQQIGAPGGDSGPVRQRRRLASPAPGTTIGRVHQRPDHRAASDDGRRGGRHRNRLAHHHHRRGERQR